MAESNGAAWEYLDKKLNKLVEQNDKLVEQNETITSHTEELPRIAAAIENLSNDLVGANRDLVSVLTNRTPDGTIPLSTHRELMKTQSRLSAIMVLVALGLGPSVEKLIGWFSH